MITIEEVKAKTPERFWSKVQFGEPKECWEWLAVKNNKGYGQIGMKKKIVKEGSKKKFHMVLATRFMYKSVIGELSDSIKVLHTCDNCGCVNPLHLFLGTQYDNMQDMISKKRSRHDSNKHGSEHGMAKLTEDKVMEIKILLVQHKHTHKEIAKQYGVYKSTIGKIARGQIWKCVVFDTKIEARSGNTKLTIQDIVSVKNKLANGESGVSISKLFGVTPTTISAIKRGNRWASVT